MQVFSLRIFLVLLLASFLNFSLTLSANSANQNTAAIAMPDEFSAKVAEQVLLAGGNAVDASVAASFVLAVTYPEAGNIGGGGFMSLHIKNPEKQNQPQNLFLDYREQAPKAAHKQIYLDETGEVIPFQSLIGARAAGVPGTVLGMWEVHQKFGSLPWQDLLAPAIELAEQGFKVPAKLADTADWYQAWLHDKPGAENLNFEQYFADLQEDEIFRQPELATTLKRIAKKGAKDFYHGKTARLLAKQMRKDDGLITKQDLTEYQVKWREPIAADWQDFQVISAPPPSSGGIALAQLLSFKQNLAADFKGLKHNSPEYIHLLAEIFKLAYADRAEYLGDPDFFQVPADKLLAAKYLANRSKQINPREISSTENIQPGLVESEQTTHFSIVDFAGNAVSNTTTLNMPFGNGVVVKGAGFLLNNEMDDFSAKPGVPNIFGVVGGDANAIEPKKRMLSSMTPTILLKNNQVVAVVGTPGGSTIITSVFQALVNLIEFEMTAQQAIDADRVHHQLLPKDEIGYHQNLDQNTVSALEKMGYKLIKRSFFGDLMLIANLNNQTQAAADIRGRGVAKVIEKHK